MRCNYMQIIKNNKNDDEQNAFKIVHLLFGSLCLHFYYQVYLVLIWQSNDSYNKMASLDVWTIVDL